MNKVLATAYQYIAPAHRAIWRADIFLLLLVPFSYINPQNADSSGFVVNILLFLGLGIYYVLKEYWHPHPDDLGFSAPNEAKYWFAGFAVLLIGLSIVTGEIFQASYNWLWLGVTLATTAGAYLMRPRLSRQRAGGSGVAWLIRACLLRSRTYGSVS